MASSGSFNTSAYEVRYLTFGWDIASQSIANNTTTINWTLKGAGGSTGKWYKAGNFKVVINGTTVYSSSTRINLYNGTVVASGQFTIAHDSNGNKTFSASAEAGIYTYAVNCSGSGTFTLNQIQRYATVTNATDFNDTQNPTIYFTNPANSQLQLKMEAGGNVNLIVRDKVTTTSPYTFTLTDSERNSLRSLCPNSKTLTVRFTAGTYVNGTVTNWSYVDRTMTIIDATPTVQTLVYEDTNTTTTAVTEDDTILIQNLSTPKFTLTNVNALKYATVRDFWLQIGDVTISVGYFPDGSATGTLSHYDTLTLSSLALNYSDNQTATLYVRDSRGYILQQNITLNILAWQQPYALITTYRKNNFYTETDLTVNATYSSLDNKNTLRITYQSKKKTDTTYSSETQIQNNTTTEISLDNTYDWDLRIKLYDKFSTTTYNTTVSKGLPIIFFDSVLNSTGFNCFPQTKDSVWSTNYPIDDVILVASQTLYDYVKMTTSGTQQVLGAYNYKLLENLFEGFTVPDGYEKGYKISAQVSTKNSNQAYISLNNFESNRGNTWSGNTFRTLVSTRIFKQSEITLENVYNYTTSSQKGCNLSVGNTGSYDAEFWNITVHAYLVKSTTNLESIGSYVDTTSKTASERALELARAQFIEDYPNEDIDDYTISTPTQSYPEYQYITSFTKNSTEHDYISDLFEEIAYEFTV